MPYWLSHGRPPQSQEPVSSVLTEEEFESLPEVVYAPASDDNGDECVEAIEGKTAAAETSSSVSGDPELGTAGELKEETIRMPPVASGDDSVAAEEEDESIGIGNAPTQVEVSATNSSDDLDIPSNTPLSTYSRFSECSICIDEFELGERLILLPRCQHAFHRDCIRPWLLERQGRCPLCKTSVMHSENETDDSEPSVDDGSTTATTSPEPR